MTDLRTIRKLAKEKGYALVKIEKPVVDGGFDKVEGAFLHGLKKLCVLPHEKLPDGARDDLMHAFRWDTTPQDWDHWALIYRKEKPLTAADIKWLKGLYQHWKKK